MYMARYLEAWPACLPAALHNKLCCLLPLWSCCMLQFMNILSASQYADIACVAWPYFVSPLRRKWTAAASRSSSLCSPLLYT
jgi:hypothetical protein